MRRVGANKFWLQPANWPIARYTSSCATYFICVNFTSWKIYSLTGTGFLLSFLRTYSALKINTKPRLQINHAHCHIQFSQTCRQRTICLSQKIVILVIFSVFHVGSEGNRNKSYSPLMQQLSPSWMRPTVETCSFWKPLRSGIGYSPKQPEKKKSYLTKGLFDSKVKV